MAPGWFPSWIHTHDRHKHAFAYSLLGGAPTHFSKISLCNGQKEKIEMEPWGWLPPSRSQHKGWARRGREHSLRGHVLTSVSGSSDLWST